MDERYYRLYSIGSSTSQDGRFSKKKDKAPLLLDMNCSFDVGEWNAAKGKPIFLYRSPQKRECPCDGPHTDRGLFIAKLSDIKAKHERVDEEKRLALDIRTAIGTGFRQQMQEGFDKAAPLEEDTGLLTTELREAMIEGKQKIDTAIANQTNGRMRRPNDLRS